MVFVIFLSPVSVWRDSTSAAHMINLAAQNRACSTPVLCPVVNVQNFNRLGPHCIDHDIGKRRERQFSGTVAVAGPAPVGRGFKRLDTLIDCPHGRFRKMRVVPLEVGFDAF
jgi:hypothetical protein